MIALIVGGKDHVFERAPVIIGSAPSSHLVIAGAVERHAEIGGSEEMGFLIRHAGGWFSSTKVNGKKTPKEWVPLLVNSRIEVARTFIDFRVVAPPDYAPADREEAELLAQIAGGDDAARLVYGDWLEQRGDAARAEFLRVQHAIMTTSSPNMFDARIGKLRELSRKIDIEWRRHVARQFVEGCNGFEAPCPRDWSHMQPTERSDVRHCGGCKKDVYYCATIDIARGHAMRGNCVAVDVVNVRSRGDLAPPRMMMAGMMPMPTPPAASRK